MLWPGGAPGSAGAGDTEAPLLSRQPSNTSYAGNAPEGGWQQQLAPRTRTLLGLLTAVAAGAIGGGCEPPRPLLLG